MPEMQPDESGSPTSGGHARAFPASGNASIFAMILALLTAAAILLLIYQTARSLQFRIEAAETWSDYQVRIVKATTEEDPNLREQYSEEQNVLRQHSQDLKQRGINSGNAAKWSAYAAALLLLGTALSVAGHLARRDLLGYLGLLIGVVGIVIAIKALL